MFIKYDKITKLYTYLQINHLHFQYLMKLKIPLWFSLKLISAPLHLVSIPYQYLWRRLKLETLRWSPSSRMIRVSHQPW